MEEVLGGRGELKNYAYLWKNPGYAPEMITAIVLTSSVHRSRTFRM